MKAKAKHSWGVLVGSADIKGCFRYLLRGIVSRINCKGMGSSTNIYYDGVERELRRKLHRLDGCSYVADVEFKHVSGFLFEKIKKRGPHLKFKRGSCLPDEARGG